MWRSIVLTLPLLNENCSVCSVPTGPEKPRLFLYFQPLPPPSSGYAEICGYNVSRQPHEVRKRIGIVFQDPSLDEELTGEENLDIHGRLYGLNAATRRSRTEEVLVLVDLQDRRRDPVKTYSGGMRRRLEIARGLMHRPKALFLDEPTLGLDPQTRRRIWNYIRTLKESFGMTVILTTHYMDEADQLCSRVAIIDRGRIVALDTPQALKASVGGDLIELETGDHAPEFVDHLAGMEEIAKVVGSEGTVLLTVGNGESFIPRCFEVAQKYSVQISSVSLRKPNLEDVFIQLTGREIREEASAGPRDRWPIFLQAKRR